LTPRDIRTWFRDHRRSALVPETLLESIPFSCLNESRHSESPGVAACILH